MCVILMNIHTGITFCRAQSGTEVAIQPSRAVPNGGSHSNTNIYTATPTASIRSTGATTTRKGEGEGGSRLSGTAAASSERNPSQQEGEDSLATSELQVATDQQR